MFRKARALKKKKLLKILCGGNKHATAWVGYVSLCDWNWSQMDLEYILTSGWWHIFSRW